MTVESGVGVDVSAGVGAHPGPTIALLGRTYPVLLPRRGDPRLMVAAVIISVQVLGQTALGFNLSIAQILITLGVAGGLDRAGRVVAPGGLVHVAHLGVAPRPRRWRP